MKKIALIALTTALLLTAQRAPAHAAEAAKTAVGFTPHLGSILPSHEIFTDEDGRRVDLKGMIDKPTIIAPVYLSCRHVCPLLLTGLADVLGKMNLVKPGKDFQVVTLSFDDQDTPAKSREAKGNYLAAIGAPFPAKAWTFLTGTEANIRKFTDAIGFHFQRNGKGMFTHPVGLVVIAPGGKIVRYLEGTTFLPFEMTMAITEAGKGEVGVSPARRALLYCFSYDPLKHSYVFNILQVTGAVMLLFLGSFLAYLLISTKKYRKDKDHPQH